MQALLAHFPQQIMMAYTKGNDELLKGGGKHETITGTNNVCIPTKNINEKTEITSGEFLKTGAMQGGGAIF